MHTIAYPRAVDPLNFGRRRPTANAVPDQARSGDDLRLFMWTFAGGFLAMSVYLA